MTCSFAGCYRAHFAYGLCNSHSKQFQRGGPMRPIQPREPKDPPTLAEHLRRIREEKP